MIEALHNVEVITLFVDDLRAATAFYERVFGGTVVFQDAVSVAFKLTNLMVNLLAASEAQTLMAPSRVETPDAGARALLTIRVEDAKAVCAQLRAHGVELRSGPVDQPWGRRTATFADPAGHIWEIAEVLLPNVPPVADTVDHAR